MWRGARSLLGTPPTSGPPAPLQGLWSTAPRTRIPTCPGTTGAVVHSPTPSTAPGLPRKRAATWITPRFRGGSAISISGPSSLASACRTNFPIQDLLYNIHLNINIPLDTSRARSPAWLSIRRDLFTRGPHARHIAHPPAHPTKDRPARASAAPGARQAPSPAPKTAVLQSLMREPLSVEEVQALGEHIAEQAVHLDAAMHRLPVSYTHLTLPTSDLV